MYHSAFSNRMLKIPFFIFTASFIWRCSLLIEMDVKNLYLVCALYHAKWFTEGVDWQPPYTRLSTGIMLTMYACLQTILVSFSFWSVDFTFCHTVLNKVQ